MKRVLPAMLAVLGERAWYLPAWLRWLPGRGLVCEGARLRRHSRPATHGQLAPPRPAAGVPAGAGVTP